MVTHEMEGDAITRLPITRGEWLVGYFARWKRLSPGVLPDTPVQAEWSFWNVHTMSFRIVVMRMTLHLTICYARMLMTTLSAAALRKNPLKKLISPLVCLHLES